MTARMIAVLAVVLAGCDGGRTSKLTPDAGDDADQVTSDVPPSPVAPDVVEADAEATTPDGLAQDAGIPDSLPADAVAICNRVPIANVYGCETADRITAPFSGVDRNRITIYLDDNPIPSSLWRLADGGNTIVIQHCAGTMVMSFSLDCRTTDEGAR